MSQLPSVSGDGPRLGKVPSGIDGLDIILEGGFLEGGITIIQGKPGAGKTILGNQLCFNHVAAGGRALYVTLLAETHARMLLHIGNLALFRSSAIPDQLSYLSAFPVLETEGVQGLLTLLRREVRASKATLLVLDGLVAAETAAGSDMEFKKFIHELQTLATVTDCAMFLLTSGGDNPAVAGAEHTMVDCVIEMRSRLHGWRADRDLEILKRRGDAFLRGRHAFRISDTGIALFPRFEALLATPTSAEYAGGPRVSTGLAQLDNMLDGGVPRPSTTLLLGPSGSGKTTLGLHFLSQCTPDEPGLFFGCYETRSGIRTKTAALGLPLAGLLDEGHVEFLWQPTTEALLDETCAQLLSATRARGVRRLFVDGLGGIAKLTESPERVGHVFTALFNELRALQVVSLFSKESDDLLGSLVASQPNGLPSGSVSDITDNILLFQFIRLRSKFYRAVSTFKARDSRIDDQARLFQITAQGIVIDDSPDRAEAIFAEATTQPGSLKVPFGVATQDQRPREN
jgi:circadian clock protein KaiC